MPDPAPRRKAAARAPSPGGRTDSRPSPKPERGDRRAAPSRSFEQIAGANGLVTRVIDRIVDNPAQAGGLLLAGVVLVAIVTNAAFFQRVHHPDPFFVTRPESARPESLRPDSAPPDAAGVPLPKSRAAAVAPAAVPAVASVSSLVSDTQKALAAIRLYDGPVDGVLGAATRASIAAFEKKIGLLPSGQPTARLLVQIRKGVPGTPSAPAPHAGGSSAENSDAAPTGSIETAATRSRVRRIQEALNRLGYGPVETDGQNGGKTATAVRRFQLDNGLPMNGIADATVMAKLVMIGAVPAP